MSSVSFKISEISQLSKILGPKSLGRSWVLVHSVSDGISMFFVVKGHHDNIQNINFSLCKFQLKSNGYTKENLISTH